MKLHTLQILSVALFAFSGQLTAGQIHASPAGNGILAVEDVAAENLVLAATDLTPKQMGVQATKTVDNLSSSQKSIQQMLEDARNESDTVKTSCLNDKLGQINSILKLVKEQQSKLANQLSLPEIDMDVVNHSFRLISIAGMSGDNIHSEAQDCIGSRIPTKTPTPVVSSDIIIPVTFIVIGVTSLTDDTKKTISP